MAMPRLVRREYRRIASLRVHSANTLAIAALMEQALCLWRKPGGAGREPERGQTAAGYRQILQARERFEKTAHA
jgi:hypothetical protein